MRVLVVAPRLEIGGTEMQLARLLPQIRQSGIDVSLFTISRGGPIESKLVQAGIFVDGIEIEGGRAVSALRAGLELRRQI